MLTRSPAFSAATISSRMILSVFSASALLNASLLESPSISSVLVIEAPAFPDRRPNRRHIGGGKNGVDRGAVFLVVEQVVSGVGLGDKSRFRRGTLEKRVGVGKHQCVPQDLVHMLDLDE